MKVERVIFLQGEDADEALKIFNNDGVRALFNHLSQWHYPEEHETSDNFGHGLSDATYRIDDYMLSVNIPLNYVGLEYILNEGGLK